MTNGDAEPSGATPRSAIARRLTSPWLVVFGTVLGAALGGYWPVVGNILEPLGHLYVAVLSICIVPIILTALIGGTGSMLRNPTLRPMFRRFALVYLALLLIPATVALITGMLLRPGNSVSPETVAHLGELLANNKAGAGGSGLEDFFINIIPSNIFADLNQGNFVAIVVFALLLGIGLGSVESPGTDDALRIINALFSAFSRIFEWIMMPLAFGLFCIMAGAAAKTDLALFFALTGYVWAFLVACFAVLAIYTILLLSLRCVRSPRDFGHLRRPLVIAFLTNSPIIALRPTISSLVDRFGIKPEVTKTVVPFGVVAAQHGQIINIVMLAIFLADIYGVELSVDQLVTLGIGGTIGGTALFGGGGAIAPAVGTILGTIGIPSDLATVILVTTGQIIGPFVSLITIYATAALLLFGGGAKARITPGSREADETERQP